ncbi:M20/M25/M40 family metallo-hydrolase [Candidatus Latescibacterota bacterium]
MNVTNRREFLGLVTAGLALAGCGNVSVEGYVGQHGNQFMEDFLFPFVQIPSVSSDPKRKSDVLRASRFLVDELRRSKLDARAIELEEGNPIVYGERHVSSQKPTVLVYGHYDVQPIKLPDKWVVDGVRLNPFEPTVIDGRVYGRGTADDKGQMAAHALAMRYFNEASDFPCNIKMIFEGNEEGGGSTIEDFIQSNQDLLACDAVIVSDTGTLVEGHPALTTSLKGYCGADLKSTKPEELIAIIHSSHNPRINRTLLNGFYDNVASQQIDPATATLAESGDPRDDLGTFLKPEVGFTQLEHRWYRPTNSPLFLSYANPNPSSRANQKTIKIVVQGPNTALHSGHFGGPVQEPALNLAHVLGGLKEEGVDYEIDYIDYGSRVFSTSIQPTGEVQITFSNKVNINPAIERVVKKYDLFGDIFSVRDVSNGKAYLGEERFTEESHTPTARVSFRLVPNQNPQRIYDSFVELTRRISPYVEIKDYDLLTPFNTDTHNRYFGAVMRGLQQGYGTNDVHLKASGGTIPITHTFANTLHAPIILAGFASPTDNKHAPRESIPIEKGIFAGARSMAYAFREIGAMRK